MCSVYEIIQYLEYLMTGLVILRLFVSFVSKVALGVDFIVINAWLKILNNIP